MTTGHRPERPSALVASRGIYRQRQLAQLLGDVSFRWRPAFLPLPRDVDFCLGWGLKAHSCALKTRATGRGLPFLHIEDGFYRSRGLGVLGDEALALVVDDLGIYYDATRPSRLECLLNGDGPPLPDLPVFAALDALLRRGGADPLDDPGLLARAAACIRYVVDHRLSKFNDGVAVDLGPRSRPRVLVVDQTAGDMSIQYGRAEAETFSRMLEAARTERPEAEVLVKIHPDVVAGKKRGHLQAPATALGLRLLAVNANPIDLLAQVDHVYVVTSQMGFEALLLGRPVTCFGAPFYAGWGLTDDRLPLPQRRRRRSVEQLFAAACLLYSRYLDPVSGEPGEIEAVLRYLAAARGDDQTLQPPPAQVSVG